MFRLFSTVCTAFWWPPDNLTTKRRKTTVATCQMVGAMWLPRRLHFGCRRISETILLKTKKPKNQKTEKTLQMGIEPGSQRSQPKYFANLTSNYPLGQRNSQTQTGKLLLWLREWRKHSVARYQEPSRCRARPKKPSDRKNITLSLVFFCVFQGNSQKILLLE